MADKTIGELPGISYLDADSLFVAEQSRQAVKVSGKQLIDFANVETEERLAEIRQKSAQAEASAISASGSAEAAASSERNAKSSETNSAASAAEALTYQQSTEAAKTAAEGHAETARSWAEGGTDTREGEETNNAKYWAWFAQSQAESVTVPAAEGVYNVVLQDRVVASDRYALIVENGVLKLLGVKNTLDAATPTLIDTSSGTGWKLAVDNGKLLIEEV